MRRIVYGLFLLPLAFWGICGGTHWGSSLILTGMTAAMAGALFACGLRRASLKPKIDMSWLSPHRGPGLFGIMLSAMIAATLLSVMPLPIEAVAHISPENAKIQTEAASLIGVTARFGYITASRGRTYYALWHLCGFLSIYFICLRLGESRRFSEWFCRSIVTVGAVWCIWIFLGQIGIDASAGAGGNSAFMRLGLPINGNHVSGALVLLSLCSLGGALQRRHKDAAARRGLWAIACAVFGVCLFMLQSRGAIFAWICAHIVFALILWRRGAGARKKATAAIFLSVASVIALSAIAAAPSIGAVKTEFEETAIEFDAQSIAREGFRSKTQIYGDLAPMIRDWPMGTGRSAFGDVYPAYQSFWFSKRMRHAENEYIEWVSEYGIALGSLLIALFVWSFARRCRAFVCAPKEQTAVIGLLCGLIGVGLQNLFDFGLRYWTVGFVFFAAAGVVDARMNRWRFGKMRPTASECASSRSSQTFSSVGRGEPIPAMPPESEKCAPSRRDDIVSGICAGIALAAFIASCFHISEGVEGHTGIYLQRTATSLSADGAGEPRMPPAQSEDAPFGAEQRKRIAKSFAVSPHSDGLRLIVGRRFAHRSASKPDADRKPDLDRARRWLESAVARAPHERAARLVLGKTCEVLGDMACAADQFLTAADGDPKAAPQAMEEYAYLPEQFLRLPQSWTAQQAFIGAFLMRGKYESAERYIAQIGDESKRMQLLYKLYMELGADEAAETVISKALSDNPNDFEVYKLKIDLYIYRKQYGEMFEALENGRSLFADNAEYWRHYLYCAVWHGMALGEERYREKADALFLRVYRYRKSSPAWRLAYDLSRAKYALTIGNGAQAEYWAKKALSVNPNHREAKRICEKAESTQK